MDDIPDMEYSAAGGMERTCAVIKPEAAKFKDEIVSRIAEEGFEIVQTLTVQLTQEQALEFYDSHNDDAALEMLVTNLSNAPVFAMCLAKINAIEDFKILMGSPSVSEAQSNSPESLRAKYGDEENDALNGIHGSENAEAAIKEILFFFPHMILEPMLREPQLDHYFETSIHPTLLNGLNELCRAKPTEPVVFLADWLLMNNPNRPQPNDNSANEETFAQC